MSALAWWLLGCAAWLLALVLLVWLRWRRVRDQALPVDSEFPITAPQERPGGTDARTTAQQEGRR